MRPEFSERFLFNLKKLLPSTKPCTFLLAVSGGIDSMVMADLFIKNNKNIGIAHCNFQLRNAASSKDEVFVKQYADSNQIPFYVCRFDTSIYAKAERISIQMAARKLRYDWFQALSKENQYDYIVTAHHSDDQTETILLNLFRGKGVHSLSGIPAIKNKILRPLLFASKNDIEEYASANHLEWRNDDSNNESEYDRNFLRLQIIPLLKQLNPALGKSLSQTSLLINELANMADQEFEKWKKENVKSDADRITILHISQFNHIVLKLNFIYKLLSTYNFQPAVIRQVSENLLAQPGTAFHSQTHHLIVDRDEITIIPNNEKINSEQYWIHEHLQSIQAGNNLFKFELISPSDEIFSNAHQNIAYADADRLHYPLLLRRWQEGDTFYPLGMKHQKKISDFFIDEKVSTSIKGLIWMLVSNNDIVWIAGYRIDDRFKVTTHTKSVLKITFAERL